MTVSPGSHSLLHVAVTLDVLKGLPSHDGLPEMEKRKDATGSVQTASTTSRSVVMWVMVCVRVCLSMNYVGWKVSPCFLFLSSVWLRESTRVTLEVGVCAGLFRFCLSPNGRRTKVRKVRLQNTNKLERQRDLQEDPTKFTALLKHFLACCLYVVLPIVIDPSKVRMPVVLNRRLNAF